MALSGMVRAFSTWANTISALAEYPERSLPDLPLTESAGTVTAALISNWLAPLLSVAFGEIYSKAASNFRSCNAPMVIFIGMPSTNWPTSVSSMLPRKIRSFMLATEAIVVPSLNVLERMTEFPTLTGMSRMTPLMVERTRVDEAEAFDFDTPSRTTCKASWAATTSSLAWFSVFFTLSYSSADTSFWL